MSDNNLNSNINSNSFTEKDAQNITNEVIKLNNSEIENFDLENSKKEKSKSPNKSKKKKKKRRNRHIRIICRENKNNKSASKIREERQKIMDDPKNFQINGIGGKVLTKLFLIQLIKKKKMYCEKVKLMKIIKRNASAKMSNNPSTLNLIKDYSQKVYNTNKEIINIQKKREEEREKEKLKEIFGLLGIKESQMIKSENLILNISPSLNKNNAQSSIRLFNNSGNSPIILRNVQFIGNVNKIKNLKINNRYFISQVPELRHCESSGIESSRIVISKENNNNNKSFRNINQSFIKVIINSNSQSNIFNKQNHRAKSPSESRQKASDRFAQIRKSYQKQTVSESIKEFNRLYYLILPGNASYLIKNCMTHRTKWREAFSYATNLFNFKWQQISYGIDYTGLGKFGAIKQVVNHYENHCAISNKANMFINLMYYCERRKLSVFKYVPFTIVFELKSEEKISDEEKEKKYQEQLEKLKNFIDEVQNYVVNYNEIGKYYQEENFIKEKEERIDFFEDKSKKKKKHYDYGIESEEVFEEDIKEFNGNFTVYRDIFKKVKNIEKVPTLIRKNVPSFEKYKEKKLNLYKTIGTNTVVEIPDTHYMGKNLWVIKAINLNRGMCIQISNNFNQMKAILNKFKEGVDYYFTEKIIDESQKETIDIENKNHEKKENTKDDIKEPKKENKEEESKSDENKETNKKTEKDDAKNGENENLYYCTKIIIQKYIEKPLLYKGRKCDMRVWVLITHQMKVYFFKEGHLKTCSITYDIDSKDAFRHITNYSFQKYNNNFQKFEKGNEVPFYEFQKFIDDNYPERNYKLNRDLTKQIKEIVTITTQSVKEDINKNDRNYQFEIFGYDFMLDENFNLFLIEINTNPGMEESSPWIKIIVPRMLDDALRLTLDQLFNPEYDFSKIYRNEEDRKNIEIVFNNLKNKIDPNAPDCLTDINNSIEKEDKNKDDSEKLENISNSCQTELNNCTTYSNKEEKSKEENNLNINKSNGYISPFPVPGYAEYENLWEFVCDLNSYDPLDDYLDKEKTKVKHNIRIKYPQKKNKTKKEQK